MKQINALLPAPSAEELRLAQLKLSLEEKLETLKQPDAGMLELTSEDDLESEMQQADEFKNEIYSAIIRLRPVSAPVPMSATAMSRTPPPSDDRINGLKLTFHPLKETSPSGRPFGIRMSLPFTRILTSQKVASLIFCGDR